MAYTDKDALKVYLDIPSATTADDALLTTLIARAQAAIERYCGQTFEAAADSTRTFLAMDTDDGGAVDGRDLIFDEPLCAITSVTNGDGAAVAAGSYSTLPRNATPWYGLRLKISSGLWWTYTNDVESDTIAVTGRWAYSVSAPEDVVQATTRLAAWFYRQRDNANDLDRALVVGDVTVLPARIPQDVRDLLIHYRRGAG